MKFYGGVLGSTMKNWLNFGGDMGILRWVNEQKNTIIVWHSQIVVQVMIQNFFFYRWGGRGGGGSVTLSPPRLNIFTVGNMGVMICLSQGGLRFLSASSCLCVCLLATLLKSYEQIAIKFYGGVLGGKRIKWLDFGSDPDHHVDCSIWTPAITQQLVIGFWWNF